MSESLGKIYVNSASTSHGPELDATTTSATVVYQLTEEASKSVLASRVTELIAENERLRRFVRQLTVIAYSLTVLVTGMIMWHIYTLKGAP